MSKFFNRNWKAGFTLVELIVVIAILAILAGIAIPVYSGYIKKANEAADNQLLGAVNTAFAAACLENNQNNRGRADAALMLTDDGKVSSVCANAAVNSSFEKYFSGNGDSAFKTMKAFGYNSTEGVFFGDPDGVVIAWHGQSITLLSDDLENIKNSDFIVDNSIEALLGQVNHVVSVATSSGGDCIAATAMSDEYLDFFEQTTGLTKTEMLAIMTGGEGAEAAATHAAELGINLDNPNTLLANSMILYAAKNVDTVASQDFVNMLKNGTADSVYADLIAAYQSGSAFAGADLSKAAGIYAMNMALDNYNSSNDTSLTLSEFMDTTQGQTDLAAYISSMSILTNNLNSTDKTAEILNNGVDNDLIELLNNALGFSQNT